MTRTRAFPVMQYFFGLLVLLFVAAPVAWMFITSISIHRDIITVPLRFIPRQATLQRYLDVFTNPENEIANAFKIAMRNSLIVSGSVTVISLVIGSLASYAFARLRFAFKSKILYLILFTYMIPSVVVVMPLYLLLSRLGMLNSRPTLVLLYLTMTLPFVIWVMQTYFGSLSRTFEESASLEGCNRLQVLWHIYFPMARPGIIATAILSFLIAWDEFFFALIFTSTLDAKTISVAIAEFSGKHYVDYEMIAAGGVIAALPPVLIAVIFQKYIVMGMTAGGIKE
ncbi:MAG TPA: carbohydrate ABC transporter permease [Spirochaetia bacterium]|nr:carbohydrate ABC transporter permease [Spirochaetia bacterium]